MRIAVVLPDYEPYSEHDGGALAIVTAGSADALASQGCEVLVLGPRTRVPYGSGTFLAYTGSAMRGFGPLGPGDVHARRVARLTMLLDSSAPDAVLVANDPDLVTELAARRPQLLVGDWLHNDIVPRDPIAHGAAIARTRLALAVSASVAKFFAQQTHVPASVVRVAHNGVDHRVFAPPLGERSDVPNIVFVGRLDPNKGPDVAAAAVARAKAEGLACTFDLYGRVRAFGISKKDLREYLASLHTLVANVDGRFMGSTDRRGVAQVLRRADVVFTPSRSAEPFCLVALEAMASGCAVIASARGGLPEVCGEAGIYVDPDNPAEVSSALTGLLRDPAALASRKHACIARSRRFTWDHTAKAVIAAVSDARSRFDPMLVRG